MARGKLKMMEEDELIPSVLESDEFQVSITYDQDQHDTLLPPEH